MTSYKKEKGCLDAFQPRHIAIKEASHRWTRPLCPSRQRIKRHMVLADGRPIANCTHTFSSGPRSCKDFAKNMRTTLRRLLECTRGMQR